MSAEIEKAFAIACNAHSSQKDKGGNSYICHPLYVASQQKTPDGIIVGLLHDVVEDSTVTIEDLRKNGFSENILTAIGLLTHKNDIDYFDYVRAIRENELARNVKIADLKHNSQLDRLQTVTEKDIKRVEKYQKALRILMDLK